MLLWAILGGTLITVIVLVCYLLSSRAPRFSLPGKRVIVTGGFLSLSLRVLFFYSPPFLFAGSSGIGLATAKMLLQQGCSVCIIGRNEDRLRKAEEELKPHIQKNCKLLPISADVCDQVAIQSAVERVVSTMGGVDALIASAGASKPGHFLQLALSEFEEIMVLYFVFLCNK